MSSQAELVERARLLAEALTTGGTAVKRSSFESIIADFMSSLFGEVRDISSYEAAGVVLHAIGSDKRSKLEGEILAAWLNYATGAVGVTTEGKIDLEWIQILYDAENVAKEPGASSTDLMNAEKALEAAQRSFD